MNGLWRFWDGFTSPQQDNYSVTSARIWFLSEKSAHTSSNKPPPLNNDIILISSNQQQIVSRLVTPMMLLDEPPNTQYLVNDKLLLQLQATQQIIWKLDETRDIKFEQNRAICEAW